MTLDPVKLVIFIAVFAALLLLGRKLSSYSSSHALSGPSVPPAAYGFRVDEEVDEEVKSLPALVGTDLPFPIYLPPVERNEDGRYNRPEFLNYYFAKTDLATGPADPRSFVDQFFLEARDPEHDSSGTYQYTVATPSGLQRELDSMHEPVLALGHRMIIVSQWDVPLILKTVVAAVLKTYHENKDMAKRPLEDVEDAS